MARSYKPNELGKFLNDLKKQTEKAMADDVARSVVDCIRKWLLEEVYNSYSPEVYNRTYLLLNSVKVSPVISSGGISTIKIYIPNEKLGHTTIYGSKKLGLQPGDEVSVSDVFNWLENGYTWGRNASNVEESVLEELKTTHIILKRLIGYLRSRGYKIV